MPRVVSDIVDVYVFRRLNGRVQFLLLQRKQDVSMGSTWQAFHSQIQMGETTLKTVERIVSEAVNLDVAEIYSADYINQFYDEARDALVLSPVFAVTLKEQSPVQLGAEYKDAAWLERDAATSRLPFSGQRWAVRHIDEIMSIGEAERNIYKLDTTIWQPTHGIAESIPTPVPDASIEDERTEITAEHEDAEIDPDQQETVDEDHPDQAESEDETTS